MACVVQLLAVRIQCAVWPELREQAVGGGIRNPWRVSCRCGLCASSVPLAGAPGMGGRRRYSEPLACVVSLWAVCILCAVSRSTGNR